MTKRMNYGPRFNNGSVVSGLELKYDPILDREARAFKHIRKTKSPMKLAFIAGKAQGNGPLSKKRVGKLPIGDPPDTSKTRSEYENEAFTKVVQGIGLIEAAMLDLNEAAKIKGKDNSGLSRLTIIKGLDFLRSGISKRMTIGPRRNI